MYVILHYLIVKIFFFLFRFYNIYNLSMLNARSSLLGSIKPNNNFFLKAAEREKEKENERERKGRRQAVSNILQSARSADRFSFDEAIETFA